MVPFVFILETKGNIVSTKYPPNSERKLREIDYLVRAVQVGQTWYPWIEIQRFLYEAGIMAYGIVEV